MPVVHREGPYRFFFYMGDGIEPPHVHVERDNLEAKFWLDPVMIADGGNFRPVEVNRIARIIEERQDQFMGAWNDRFGS